MSKLSISRPDYWSKFTDDASFSKLSPDLEKLFETINDDDLFGRGKYELWVQSLKKAYPSDKNDMTHFFFLIGPVFFGSKEEKELEKFIVSANVGIQYGQIHPPRKQNIRAFLKHLKIFINKLTYFIILRLKEENLIKLAVRASLAQVMARNMSHNIGSHVLVNVVNDIEKKYGNTQDGKDLIKTLLNYIKVRMDYIADITTGTPVMENTKSLKKVIIQDFRDNTLLTDTISGIDQDKFQYEIVVEDDCLLSIPNDVLGNHAFYTILENLIRNTAKHGKVTGKVTFKIEAKEISEEQRNANSLEDENEIYAISIVVQNNVEGKKVRITKKDNKWMIAKDGIEAETIEVEKIDWLIYELNSTINESVIDTKTNTLRQGGWGLLEMEASAAYLRKIPMEDIEEDRYEVSILKDEDTFVLDEGCYSQSNRLNILKACKATDGDKNYLAYRFFVYKPREVLIIGNKKEILGTGKSAVEKEWLNAGIKIVETVDKSAYPHKLALDCNNSIQEEDDVRFSANVLKTLNAQYIQEQSTQNAEKLLLKFWQEFAKEQYKNNSEKLLLKMGEHTLIFGEGCNPKGYRKCFEGIENRTLTHAKDYNVQSPKFCEIKTTATEMFFHDDEKTVTQIKEILSRAVKIKIIDERIQHHALNNSYSTEDGKKINYYSIYRKTGIIVPVTDKYQFQGGWMKDNYVHPFIDLNEQNFDQSYTQIRNYMIQEKMDFCVIHLGIIEKMIESYNRNAEKSVNDGTKSFYDKRSPNDIEAFIKNFIINGSHHISYNKIIMITGRGKPHNLPVNIRFLNYSIVAQYLIDRRNKFAFTEAIYSARNL